MPDEDRRQACEVCPCGVIPVVALNLHQQNPVALPTALHSGQEVESGAKVLRHTNLIRHVAIEFGKSMTQALLKPPSEQEAETTTSNRGSVQLKT